MKRLILPLSLLLGLVAALPSCTLWKRVRPLSSDEKKQLVQYESNARQYYDAERYTQAIQQAERVLDLDPGNKNAPLVIAWSHLRLGTRDDIWKAEQEFSDINGGIFTKDTREAVLGHGFALRRQGDFYAAAITPELEKAARTDSAKAEGLANLRKESGAKYSQATERLKRAYELDPEATDALVALQQIYALQGNFPESVRYGTLFVTAASKSWPFWEKQILRTDISTEEEKVMRSRYETSRQKEIASRSLLASCLFKQEQYPQALVQLDALLAMDSERAEDYFNRALCREKVGDLQGAVADMELFVKKTSLAYESAQVRQAYDSIAQWKGLLSRGSKASGSS